VTAKTLGETLDLDAGYLSRILKRFEGTGLLQRTPDPSDGRSQRLTLTAQGRAAFQRLNARSESEIAQLIAPLGALGRARLGEAIGAVRGLLEAPAPLAPVILRPHRTGDMGWVVRQHAVLYAAEQGWDERFEAMVAGICADFIRNFDPQRERCWMAERGGEPVGSVFVVADDEQTARLRLLLIDPSVRGMGLGRRLVRTCIDFAREKGYARIVLWTQSILTAARRAYEAEGFVLTASEPHDSLGFELIGETWTLEFKPDSDVALT
jgi:GNAT superfamily N-acetyltransferase